MKAPTNPAGAPVLSCDLDEHCVQVDCEADLPELPDSLADNPEAPDYVAHYCGLDYLAKHVKQGQYIDNGGNQAEETPSRETQ